MAFCPKCGAQIDDGARFCIFCGSPIAAVPQPAPAQPVQPAEPVQYAPAQPAEPAPAVPETVAVEPEAVTMEPEAAPAAGSYSAAPQQSYTAPQQSYTAPEQSYTAPQQSYTAPQQSYAAPQQSYAAPQQSYAAPQQSYTAPQQGYTAPQQGYTAPQQGYAAPQQGYTAPQQGYQQAPQYGAAAPKQKKPFNKKLFFIIGGAVLLTVILAVALILVFGGKGGGNVDATADDTLGVYNAATAEMWGFPVDVSDFFSNGFSIELKAKGKCALNVDGTTANGKWTLDGTAFHVEGGGIDCDGTLDGGVITLENVLGIGLTITFVKEGVVIEEPFVSSTTALVNPSEWYGTLSVTNCSDGTADFSIDVWGAIDAIGELSWFEVWDAPRDQDKTAVLSMYIYDDDQEIRPFIGDGDAWLMSSPRMYLTESDAAAYTIPLVNGALDLTVPYSAEGFSCTCRVFMREDGAEWDVDNDPLPQSYYTYYPETSGSSTAAPVSGYGLSNAAADGIVTFAQLQTGSGWLASVTAYDSTYGPVTYQEVAEHFGVDGYAYVDSSIFWDDTYHSYIWQTEGGFDFQTVTFEVNADGSETYSSRTWSSSLN